MTSFSGSYVVDQENAFPNGFFQLFSVANVESTSEALSVFLHTCMLDVGFLPVNVEERNVYKCMPDDWKGTGAWKFQYCHKTCHDVFCWMTCVPLYSCIAVHGALDDGCSHNIYIKLKTTKYLNSQAGLVDAENLFVRSEKLLRKFKDEFCFPLLAVLQERAGCEPSFGLCITVDEIKLDLLKLLPVQSVLSLSSVNKDFHRVANSPALWKHLIQRDFGLIDVPSNLSGEGYKELYKKEYQKKKQRPRRPFPMVDPYYFPSIFPMGPPGYVDLRRDLDPALQQAFPHLRDRFRPNYIFPPYDYPGRFM